MRGGIFAAAVCAAAGAVCGAARAADDDAWLGKVRTEHPRLFLSRDNWPAVKARAEGVRKDARARLLKRADDYPAEPVCSGTEGVPMERTVLPDGSVFCPVNSPIPNVREWGHAACECALAWKLTGRDAYLEKAKRMLAVSVAAYGEADRNHRAVNWYSTSRILWLAAYDWIFGALTPAERRELMLPFVAHVKLNLDNKYTIVRRNGGGTKSGYYSVRSLQWYTGLAAWRDGVCDADAERLLRDGYREMVQMCDFRNAGAGDDGGLASAVPGYSLGAYPWAHFNFFHTYLSATGENIAPRWPALAYHANWIYWMWIPDAKASEPLYCGFGDDLHTTNRLLSWSVYEHLTQYMHFYKDADRDAAGLAKALRGRLAARTLGETWPFYPFVLDDGADVAATGEATLADFPVKARHFEKLGQFVMRSGWTTNATFAFFTAGAEMRMHKHHDENNFVIFKNDFLALDSGSRGAQNDLNLKHYYAQTVAHNCVLIRKPGEPLPGYWGPADKAAVCNDGGQYGGAARVLAFETADDFSYVASDAAACYGAKCTEAVRQFVHVQPDVFVVYDRTGAGDAAWEQAWLLHTAERPERDGAAWRADNGGGRLFCETLLPADARAERIGGEGKEFWSGGRNWPLNRKFVETARAACARDGRGPYFGAWRLEVSARAPAKEQRFLHVLTAADSAGGRAAAARLVATGTQDGAALTLPDGRAVTVMFNRAGPVGGSITLAGRTRPLAQSVQPQRGVLP